MAGRFLESIKRAREAVTVWGSMTTQTFGGGPARGSLEGTLRYLASLGGATVVGAASRDGGADAA